MKDHHYRCSINEKFYGLSAETKVELVVCKVPHIHVSVEADWVYTIENGDRALLHTLSSLCNLDEAWVMESHIDVARLMSANDDKVHSYHGMIRFNHKKGMLSGPVLAVDHDG